MNMRKKRLNLSSFFIIKGLKIVLSPKSLRTTGVNNFYWKMTNYFPASMMIATTLSLKQILLGVPKEIKSIKNLKQSSAGYTQQCTVNKPIRVYYVFCQVQIKLAYITMK